MTARICDIVGDHRPMCGVDFSLAVMQGCPPPFGRWTAPRSASPAGRLKKSPNEGFESILALIRRFLEASPCRARTSRRVLLPKGEGHASGFSLIWTRPIGATVAAVVRT